MCSCSVYRALARAIAFILIVIALSACARVSVTREDPHPANPVRDYQAIETERVVPSWVEVCDFDFSSASNGENMSPANRAMGLLRRSSPAEHRVEIGREVAASLSVQTVKRLDNVGLPAVRIRADDNILYPGNNLIVTGRFINVDEGNAFTRVGIGLGAGESRLDTEVHVYRVSQGERAEVLAFTTHADSGRMPGLAESMPLGVILIGPVTAMSTLENTASTGQKIYSTEIEYLAAETGDQVASYLSQYAAEESWIAAGRSANLVAAQSD